MWTILTIILSHTIHLTNSCSQRPIIYRCPTTINVTCVFSERRGDTIPTLNATKVHPWGGNGTYTGNQLKYLKQWHAPDEATVRNCRRKGCPLGECCATAVTPNGKAGVCVSDRRVDYLSLTANKCNYELL
jgi:hypothetical protein